MTQSNQSKSEDPGLKARRLFDQITGASYYGAAFRQVLRENPEAMAAAETLANALRADKSCSVGMGVDPTAETIGEAKP